MFCCPQKNPLAHSTQPPSNSGLLQVTAHKAPSTGVQSNGQLELRPSVITHTHTHTHTHTAENGVGDTGIAGVYFALCGDQQATGHETEEECFEFCQALKQFSFQESTTMIGGPHSLPSNSYRVLFPRDKAAGA